MPAVLLLIVVVAAVLVGPTLWVRHVLAKYSEPADRYRDRGTGGEFARHLIQRLGLDGVTVEPTDGGDHYDPEARAVRLGDGHFDGCSLTAVTIAAHEVGHALQHHRGEATFRLRHGLAKAAVAAERFGGIAFLAAPVLTGIVRSPAAGAAMLLAALATVALGAIVHLVTLPVELDASFNKALPLLERGRYLKGNDIAHARRILRAAAFTYVAGSMAGLLNLWRWARVLRR